MQVRHRSPLLNALVAQSQERRTSNAGDPGGRPGGGATFGDACSVEASLSCKQAVVSATLTVSTNFLRGEAPATQALDASGGPAGVPLLYSPVAQQTEHQFAELEAAGAISAGRTTLNGW